MRELAAPGRPFLFHQSLLRNLEASEKFSDGRDLGAETDDPHDNRRYGACLHRNSGIRRDVHRFYGYNGSQTASGERMNPSEMTAAHRTKSFGSQVTVTSQSSGRSVTVRINDRGPFVKGRCIDLSTGAARALGMADLEEVSLR